MCTMKLVVSIELAFQPFPAEVMRKTALLSLSSLNLNKNVSSLNLVLLLGF